MSDDYEKNLEERMNLVMKLAIRRVDQIVQPIEASVGSVTPDTKANLIASLINSYILLGIDGGISGISFNVDTSDLSDIAAAIRRK